MRRNKRRYKLPVPEDVAEYLHELRTQVVPPMDTEDDWDSFEEGLAGNADDDLASTVIPPPPEDWEDEWGKGWLHRN